MVHEAMSQDRPMIFAPHLISKLSEIRQWCWDEYVEVDRQGAHFIFHTEEDKMRFAMVWL